MRSFKTTATILVLSIIASKLIVAYNSDPLHNRWEGEIVIPTRTSSFIKTGAKVDIQLSDTSQLLTMEFSGDSKALESAGIPDGKITCMQDKVQQLGEHYFDRYYSLSATTEPWVKKSDPNWCTGLFVRVDSSDSIQVGFANKEVWANLAKNNSRGFLVGYMQDKHFNYASYK